MFLQVVQGRSGNGMFGQVWPGYNRLGQFVILGHDKTG
jgi:hypothetical protein